jgi:hypothetical protein
MTDYGRPITFGLSRYTSVDQQDVVPGVRKLVDEHRGQP